MSYVAVAIVIGLLIAIHEYGHLLAAKLCGIPVKRFSIGFGPKLFGFTLGKTSYWFSMIPFGGYVWPALEDTDFRTTPGVQANYVRPWWPDSEYGRRVRGTLRNRPLAVWSNGGPGSVVRRHSPADRPATAAAWFVDAVCRFGTGQRDRRNRSSWGC